MTLRKIITVLAIFGYIFAATPDASFATSYVSKKKVKSYSYKTVTLKKNRKTVAHKFTHKRHSAKKHFIVDSEQPTDLLKNHYIKWQGTRYQLGGISLTGIDCSGFTKITFQEVFGRTLPRTAGEQALSGKEIEPSSLQAGDLVFFKRGNGQHVGIYMENGKFIHASSSHGVSISSMNNQYWKDKFYKAARY